MRNILAIIGVVFAVSGCTVVPASGPYNSRVVVYPQVDFVYYWDPVVSRHYYEDRGRRHYMPHDWRERREYRDRGRGHGRGHD